MKKIFLSTVLLIFITGCSTEYNLEFKNNRISDNIQIGKTQTELIPDLETMEPIATFKDYNIKHYNINYDDKYIYLNYEYTIDEYRVSSALVDCFDLANISYDDKYYYILTSGDFKCLSYQGYDNKEVKINFSTDLKIESINADEDYDGIYTWVFNEDNYDSKEINIKLIRNKEIEKGETRSIPIYYIIIPIVILIAIIVFIIIKKRKKTQSQVNNI